MILHVLKKLKNPSSRRDVKIPPTSKTPSFILDVSLFTLSYPSETICSPWFFARSSGSIGFHITETLCFPRLNEENMYFAIMSFYILKNPSETGLENSPEPKNPNPARRRVREGEMGEGSGDHDDARAGWEGTCPAGGPKTRGRASDANGRALCSPKAQDTKIFTNPRACFP